MNNINMERELENAVKNGDLDKIKYLHQNMGLIREDVRAWNYASLRWAARWGHLDIVKYLIEEVGLDIEDVRASEILQAAASRGHLEIVQYLFENVKLDIKDARALDNWALRYAAENGRLHVVKYLIEEVGLGVEDVRADDNFALGVAAENGRLHVVKYLIEKFKLNIEDYTLDALRFADENGHTEVVEYLKKMMGEELKNAVKNGDLDRIKYLINDVGVDARWGLRLAASRGHLEIVQYLYQNTDFTDEDARVLHNLALQTRAAWNGHTEVVEYLEKMMKLKPDYSIMKLKPDYSSVKTFLQNRIPELENEYYAEWMMQCSLDNQNMYTLRTIATDLGYRVNGMGKREICNALVHDFKNSRALQKAWAEKNCENYNYPISGEPFDNFPGSEIVHDEHGNCFSRSDLEGLDLTSNPYTRQPFKPEFIERARDLKSQKSQNPHHLIYMETENEDMTEEARYLNELRNLLFSIQREYEYLPTNQILSMSNVEPFIDYLNDKLATNIQVDSNASNTKNLLNAFTSIRKKYPNLDLSGFGVLINSYFELERVF